MKVVILAGGKGTRLRPMTNLVPKPMVEVQGRPFLEILIKKLKKQGFDEFVFLTGYKANKIFKHFMAGSNLGVKIEYSHEENPLGTAGALKNAESLLSSRFIIMNGDTLFNFDMNKLIEAHEKNDYLVTMARTNHIDAGVAVMEQGVFDLMEEGMSLHLDLYPLLEEHRLLGHADLPGNFMDIGTPIGYLNAQKVNLDDY